MSRHYAGETKKENSKPAKQQPHTNKQDKAK
jgi:hypothetical protein